MVVALLGMSFLTPLDGLFALAAAIPLGALVVTQRRVARVRRLFSVVGPGRRALLPAAVALVLLPALVAVAAAQPVVVRARNVSERADAQAFVLFDTSLSMRASAGPREPTRLARAKRLAVGLERSLSDVPVGIASWTDRSLPNLMPTTDQTLFDRTVQQAVAIDEPPPSQQYKDRATTFDALIPLSESHFYGPGVLRRLVVIFTDGEANKISPVLRYSIRRNVTPLFVHVWQPGERIFDGRKADPHYASDPTSAHELDDIASITGGRVFPETDTSAVARAARDIVGRAGTQTRVSAYARIALAPWFILGGILPLGYLLWRRNV